MSAYEFVNLQCDRCNGLMGIGAVTDGPDLCFCPACLNTEEAMSFYADVKGLDARQAMALRDERFPLPSDRKDDHYQLTSTPPQMNEGAS
jgi:hypothetical protein